jgi:predicted transposase YdaD
LERGIVYKLTTIDRTEVEAMLGINLEESRIYQEISAEGEQKGKLALVPLLPELGLTSVQIAERTGIDLEKVQQALAKLSAGIVQHSQTNQAS